uniref:hypothetical protein n=1 Tax=Jeotgalibaca porci TaxID=1868793 RepID=UPI0035A0B81B
ADSNQKNGLSQRDFLLTNIGGVNVLKKAGPTAPSVIPCEGHPFTNNRNPFLIPHNNETYLLL